MFELIASLGIFLLGVLAVVSPIAVYVFLSTYKIKE